MELERLHQELSVDEDYRKAYAEEDLIHRIAERAVKLRKAHGLSQEELAEMLGTKQPAIATLEAGSANPTARRIARIAWALGCCPEDLVARNEPEQLQSEWRREVEIREEDQGIVIAHGVSISSSTEPHLESEPQYLGAA